MPIAAHPAPWLSILIPVYNVAPYLLACLASVAEQALDGVEVVLVDDASTDGSSALLAEWMQTRDGSWRLLSQPQNNGIGATRNCLVQASRGDYLWFLDSDDLMLPGAVARLRETLARHAVDLVLCDFKILRQNTSFKHRWRGELHVSSFRSLAAQGSQPACDPKALIGGAFASGQLHLWSKVFRRSLFADGLRFPVGRSFEDVALLPDLLARAQSHCHVPEVWIAYRKRPGSILASSSLSKDEDMMQALPGLPQRLPPGMDAAGLFACAFFCAGFFVCACRSAEKQGRPDRWPLYLAQFERSSPLALPALLSAYRRRGWWWRAAKLQRWLKRCASSAELSPARE